MDNCEERKLFVKDRLWYDSDIVLIKPGENKRFEDLVSEIVFDLDLVNLDRDRLCVEAADLLKSRNAEERDIALFLVILERTINILEAIEKEREELIELLEHEVELEQVIKNPDDLDSDYIQSIRGQIKSLKSGKYADMTDIVREYSPRSLDQAEKMKSRFDGELVRILLDHHKGNRKFTENFRGQLAALLGVSARSVTSMKAWRSGELNGSASTLNEILDKCRMSLQVYDVDESIDTKLYDEPSEEISATNELYSSIDSKHLLFIQSLQPGDLSCDKGFTRGQRRWIYVLMMHGAQSDADKKRIRFFLAKKIFKCSSHKLAAVTAYLSGKLRLKAQEKRSEIWEDIEFAEKGLSNELGTISGIEIQNDRFNEEKNPNYNNPNKEKGWRDPERRMIEKAWGLNQPLAGKRILLLDTPELLEWQMLEKMGAEERLLTIIERERELAMSMAPKIPKAKVVHDTVEHFFQSKITSDESSPIDGIVKGYNEFCLVSKRHPKLKKLLTKRKFRMPIYRSFLPDMEGLEIEEFDLISLDTKSQFKSMQKTLRVIFALGALTPNSLLFTNFVAQREGKDGQLVYDERLAHRVLSGFSHSDDPNINDKLKDRRSKAITESIRSMLQGSYSGLAETLSTRELRGKLDLQTLLTVVIDLNRRSCQISGDLQKIGDIESMLYFLMMDADFFDDFFDDSAVQLLIKRELIKSAAKRLDWIMDKVAINKFANPNILTSTLESGRSEEDLPEVFRNLLWMLTLGADSKSFGIIDHESLSYRDSTLMHSDFLWLQDVFKVTGLTRESGDLLKRALLGISKPKQKDRAEFKRNVIASLEPYFKFFFQDDMNGGIQRVSV